MKRGLVISFKILLDNKKEKSSSFFLISTDIAAPNQRKTKYLYLNVEYRLQIYVGRVGWNNITEQFWCMAGTGGGCIP